MAWTDFPPFSVGHVATAAELNALVANLVSLRASHTARAYLTANFSHVNGAENILSLTSENIDTDGYHSTSSNPSRLTVPTGLDGLYIAHAQVEFATPSGGSGLTPRVVSLILNGNAGFPRLASCSMGGDLTGAVRVDVTTLVALAAGDYIEMVTMQSSGVTLNAVAGASATFLEMAWRGKL